MNQDGRDDLAIYLGLQDFEVTRVEVERSRRRGRPIKVIYLARRSGAHRCLAGHQHDVPLGLCEAINSKIAALRYQARGYRDPEYFKLKIFQRCSLPDNPWAQIVL